MMLRWLFAVLFVFNTLATPAQALICQDIWGVSNNLTDAAQLKTSIETVAHSGEFSHPAEMRLDKEQKALLRTLVLQLILGGVKKAIDVRQWWKKSEFKDLTEVEASPLENNIYALLATMVQRKQLRHYMVSLINFARKIPFIGKKVDSVDRNLLEGYVISGGVDAAAALVEMRGLLPNKSTKKYINWSTLAKNIMATVNRSEANRKSVVRNSVHDPEYMKELLDLGHTRFTEATKLEILADGTASFKVRDRLVDEAQESIDFMVWAVLDDMTGRDVTQRLAAAVRRGVKVRMIVDGKVNQYHGYKDYVKDMEALGVEVVRWHDPVTDYKIMHRKIFIVDGKSYVAGGINMGDAYSHKNPDPSVARWRDTDVYVEGPAVQEAHALFAEMWNQQLEWYPERYSKYNKVELLAQPETINVRDVSKKKIALILGEPGDPNGTAIMHAMIKGIRGATKSIDIENAYVVLNPAIRAEIIAAIKRGVKVRILTNSQTSVDEPIISGPIMRNVAELVRLGAEVYIKLGATLHTKLLSIDGELVYLKSYNLHPRSERTDTEVALVVYDVEFGRQATVMFNNDIMPEKAKRVLSADEIKYDESWLDRLMLNLSMRLGYDVL